MAEKVETMRCGLPGERNRCIVRSRVRSGTCEFSADFGALFGQATPP